MDIKPINGKYLTSADFPEWSSQTSPLFKKKNEELDLDPELSIKTVTFVVTEACNLNCSYCYECHKTNKRMSKEVAEKAVDLLFDEEKMNNYFNRDKWKGVILEFIGGEPLIEIDLMDYIVEYFKFKAFEMDSPLATNYMISFTSNGTLYLNDKVQKFLDRNKGKVSGSITIDGNKELHDSCRVFYDGKGSYDIVEKAIKKQVSDGRTHQTKITLCPSNIKFLNDALKNVWSLGLLGAFTNCVYEEGWELKDAKVLYDQMIKLADYLLSNERYRKYFCSLFDESIGKELMEKRNWCGGNGQMLAFGTDGKCFPCIRFMKYSLSTPGREEQPVGDVYKGLDKKESNPWLLELKKVDMDSQSDEKCKTCSIATGCSLCTAYNYDKFGTPNKRATFICEMHQARVLANSYYWNKLYQLLNTKEKFDLNIKKEWALKIISEKEYDYLKELSTREVK